MQVQSVGVLGEWLFTSKPPPCLTRAIVDVSMFDVSETLAIDAAMVNAGGTMIKKIRTAALCQIDQEYHTAMKLGEENYTRSKVIA
jgi:hypothetical protein